MRYVVLSLFVLGMIAVAFVPSAEAGHCATPVVQYQQQQVYQAPVVQQAVAVQQVVVAQFVPVFVPAVMVGYDAQTLGIVEELRAIKEELRVGREALTAPKTGGPLVLPNTSPMEPLPQVDPVQSFLQARCSACHTGAKAKGGKQIFVEPGKFGTVDAFDLYEAVVSGKMPPKGKPPVTADELAILKQWVKEECAKK